MENEIHEILEQSFESLELYAVLEEAAAYCQSEPGRAELLSSTPTEDDEAFLEQMKLVSQWKEVLQLSGPLGFSGVIPLNVLLDNLRVDASRVLNPEEILSVLDIVSTAATVSYRLGRLDERYDILKAQRDLLLPMDQLRRDINRVIDEHGEVRSDASPELIRIRNKGAKTRDRVRKRLESIVRDRDLARIVQEDYITQRNDRYVILLRPEFKGLLEGIIHDHSRSGSSVYVEPFQVVELNNEVAGIEDEEREEIRRIFIELTDKIREASPELYANFKTLKRLDAFQARAIYAREIEGIEPEISGQGFRILGARHPLLIASGTQVVPMDIIQEPDTKATIISGANMGGKTVALKIAGLFPLMVRCGLLIPVQEGTKIAPFQRVMADIGDDQDIRGKVSSFSGHMLRIKSIVENASIGDLVLLDELGGATDPDEGSALAMAIVDELVEKGVRVLITTHLIHLKSYALSRSYVMNVSVEFHPVTLKPTFRLLYDLPGESHAIETAERIGLSPNVINKARAYLDKSSGGSSRLMHELREKLSQVDELKAEWEGRREVLEKELTDHRNLRDEVIENARREAQNILRQSEKRIKDLQNSIKTAKSKEEIKSLRPALVLSEIRKEITETLGVPLDVHKQPPAVGSRVLVKTWGRTGTVKDVLEGGKLDIEMGNLSVRVDSDDVEIVKGRVDKKTSLKNRQIGVHISPADPKWEINVIGMRVDEAIPIIDRAVDQALLGGLTTINVIHGKGTGRLKKAIWDHLTAHKLVRGIHSAKPELGGDGITVVEIDI